MYAMQIACFTDFYTKIVKQYLVSTEANDPSQKFEMEKKNLV